MSELTLDQLRRDAKALKKAWEAQEVHARQRLLNFPPRADLAGLKHADFLYVIARENGFLSWPKLVEAAESIGLDRAGRQRRLRLALWEGHHEVTARLLQETPDLADGDLSFAVALYRRDEVRRILEETPKAAVLPFGLARPIVHLAFSKHIHAAPEREADMLAIAEMLLEHGADVNDSRPVSTENDHPLSALYGAIGHANNMALGRLLLEHGANPDDGESLYHATELGHHEGLRLLLSHGANPSGTNALLRAMDFHDVEAVRLLLAHGARPDDFDGTHVGGEAPWVVPALHQAARRGSPPAMVELLLDHGADPQRIYQGASAYAYARVFGHDVLGDAIEARGSAGPLTREERLLAEAARGVVTSGEYIDPDKLPEAYRNIIRMILHLPGRLPHVKALVALGLEYDRPDTEGLTPVQLAGWEGLPEVLAYFLSLKPDLSHVNGYGGTLLSTIIHGSENCPERHARDYVACLRLALEAGVALPRQQLRIAGQTDVASFLNDWAERYPGQVV